MSTTGKGRVQHEYSREGTCTALILQRGDGRGLAGQGRTDSVPSRGSYQCIDKLQCQCADVDHRNGQEVSEQHTVRDVGEQIRNVCGCACVHMF